MTLHEAAFETSLRLLKAAQAAFDRSRSMKNRVALIAANEDFETKAQAARDEQARAQRAYLVAARLEATAERRAARKQPDLFA